MFEAVDSPYLVPFDGSFRVADAQTSVGKVKERKEKKRLQKTIDKLDNQQRRLYANDHWSLLLIFQAMDAAGKDSTIRAVMSGVNPAGCQVFSFKRPSTQELDHDFLWRSAVRLPERGRIGVFNRSYYEEVLVVRVHPGILDGQRLPHRRDGEEIWAERMQSIHDHELHLARNGTVILKFWLNVSREEQKARFISRLDEPEKNWKFSTGDVVERGHWDRYMSAYEAALSQTSRSWAPWYAIPADNKPYMRATVASIIEDSLESLNLKYPAADEDVLANIDQIRAELDAS